MSELSKKIAVAALLFLVAGAVLFCAFTTMPQTSSAMADMPSDHASTNHFAYIQELTAANTSTNLFTLIALFSTVIAIAFGIFESTSLSAGSVSSSYSYFRKKQRDISGLIRQTVYRWLSRLENSPSFVIAA